METTDVAPTPASIDTEKVASGVRFLSHPDVQATPLAERLEFLEKKGLSRAEINSAVEAHHQANLALAKSAPAPASSTIWSTIFPLAGTTAALGFLWKFMQYDEAQKLDTESAVDYARAPTASNETALVQAIQAQTAEMVKLMSIMQLEAQERRALLSSQTTTSQSITELRAELSSLKAAVTKLQPLIAANVSPVAMDAPNAPTELAPVLDALADFQTKASKMLDALRLVELNNDADVIKQAAGILIMYTKNLVEQPDVPRYRRIATGNANFKQKIEPLQHHVALLTSIGFEKVGMSMEWKWHGQPSNLTILKAAVSAFESAAANNGDVLSLAAENFLSAHAPSAIVVESAVATTIETPNLESFLQKLGAKQDVKHKAARSELDDVSGSSIIPSTEPSYPTSFADVMKMVQNGEEVPGIRTIEDKLSTEAQARLDTPPVATAVTKPWAK
ncbi:hypothetical protein SPRG_14376 [Saprolegnia parasitica CBS 223.65]|uniref:Peroxisomal membrane protein PEX14 n=1 Tax=Saprolegnia parasitica (strain CBS 223.65) TaxID=695850 RepID=A0A067BKN8_SAPPC|nr:hypothetical protein SPRG_14376 [Saprolegnia parasitica CBS 223.65]KDO19039.1 hypothetical protein SPRG_14376 [Saprolegnia parasitica CBS 223.65]|eukprot:XP_012210250.1 hypothetical protein SPRG_14376 [Saprolegnia parasitica CBS 223.65]